MQPYYSIILPPAKYIDIQRRQPTHGPSYRGCDSNIKEIYTKRRTNFTIKKIAMKKLTVKNCSLPKEKNKADTIKISSGRIGALGGGVGWGGGLQVFGIR